MAKSYVLPTLEDFIYMSYPESNQSLSSLSFKEGSFSAPYSQLRYQHYFSPDRFRSFVRDSHCSENLEFLIDIHRYEELWNDSFHSNVNVLTCHPVRIRTGTADSDHHSSHSSASSPLTHSRSVSIAAANSFSSSPVSFHPVGPTSPVFATSPISASSTSPISNLNESLRNLDLDVSSIVDLDQFHRTASDTQFSKSPEDIFSMDSLRKLEKKRSADESSASYSSSLLSSLSTCWNDIIETYIKPDSVCELNLPNEVIRSILSENSRKRYHEPKALLRARKMILSLLRQNVYIQFIRSVESEIQQDKEGNVAVSPPERRNPAGVIYSADVIKSGTAPLKLTRSLTVPKRPTGFMRFYHTRQKRHKSDTVVGGKDVKSGTQRKIVSTTTSTVPTPAPTPTSGAPTPAPTPTSATPTPASTYPVFTSSPPASIATSSHSTISPASATSSPASPPLRPATFAHKSSSVFGLVPRLLGHKKSYREDDSSISVRMSGSSSSISTTSVSRASSPVPFNPLRLLRSKSYSH